MDSTADVASVADAVARANATEFGLGASVWAAEIEEALPVAKQLQAGTVWVNEHGSDSEALPFGGIKASGIGREGGGQIGLREFVEAVSLNVTKRPV